MSRQRTREILEEQLELLLEREKNPGPIGNVESTTKAVRETAKTLLGYYNSEVSPLFTPMPEYMAEAIRQFDAEDAAVMEPQAADRLCDAMAKLEKRLDAIENIMKRMPEVYAAVFFRAYEEYQAAKLQGKRVSDIWDIEPPNLR